MGVTKKNSVATSSSIQIASCVDRKYLQHLAVLITSLFENNTSRSSISYHIIHDDLSVEDMNCLRAIGEKYRQQVVLHNADVLLEKYQHIVRYGAVSRAGLYRLSLPDLLPAEVKKCIYLDCDIVVCEDISSLWSVNVERYAVAAVEDAVPFNRHDTLMIPKGALYFNSGVLLINMEAWRAGDITNKVVQFMVDYPERRVYNDQDGLNAILHSRWLRLPPTYNQQSALHYLPHRRLVYSKQEYEDAKHAPAVIHYTGVIQNAKPWHYRDVHPLKKEYYKYVELTAWKGYKSACNGTKDLLSKCYLCLFRYKMKSGIVIGNIFKKKHR